MTEPSRQTAARRRREKLALARRLEAELGPDRSEIVHQFDDGWSVRCVRRIVDQRREGILLQNCLKNVRTAAQRDRNCWSLRDPSNIPRASFSAWRGRFADHEIYNNTFVVGSDRLCFLVDTGPAPDLKDAYRKRLLAFGAAHEQRLSRFVKDPAKLAWMIATTYWPNNPWYLYDIALQNPWDRDLAVFRQHAPLIARPVAA